MFKRMLSAFGVGGPSVDTVLRIQGGSADAEIGQVVLSLVTRVEVEHGDHEYGGVSEFLRVVVQQGVRVGAGQLVAIPFQLPIPWETPITAVGGGQLPGMTVGVRTELVIAGAPDKGDLDPVLVHPLPSQDAVLNAFGQLGFSFRSADVEAGRLHGVPQELGFYQEIEFYPPAQFAGAVQQVELTFVANPHELYVILEADKRGGMFSSGGDAFGHFRVSHQESEGTDWASAINGWLAQVAQRGGAMHGYDQHGGHHGGHHGRGGMGMGTVVAAGAAGLVGGMVVGEMMDDAFEDFGDFGGE
jgi:sporulation-control protein